MNAIAGRLVAASPVRSASRALVHGREGRTLQVGLMTLGGHQVAIPVAHVREVVPCPPVLAPSLAPATACVGSILVRGTAIPVLDLSLVLNIGRTDASAGVIVIIQDGERLAGVMMDAVSGLARLTPNQVQPCHYASTDVLPIVSHNLVLDDVVASLLDPGVMLQLPGVPYASEAAADGTRTHPSPRRGVVLLKAAGVNIAIEASRFVATVPNVALRSSPVPSSSWAGVVDYLGQEVPVIDDLSLLGLAGRTASTGTEPVVVLRADERHLLGIKIERVRRIVQVPEDEIHPLEDALAQKLKLFCGTVADGDGQQSLLLDPDALERSEPLRMLGRLSVKEADGPATAGAAGRKKGVGSGRAAKRKHYLVFRSGETFHACDLHAVARITPFPADYAPVRVPGSALLGLATHEARPLPLLDCAGGQRSDPLDLRRASVLVVPMGETVVGLVVDALENVTRAVPQEMPGPPSARRSDRFVEVQAGGKPAALKIIDAQETARQLAASCSGQVDEEVIQAEPLLNIAL